MEMPAPSKVCADCGVRDRALCAALDDEALAALNSIGRKRRVTAGETVVWEGDDNIACANVLDGVLKLSTSTSDGRESIVGLLYPADFLGRPYAPSADYSVTALTDAELCIFPRGPFEAVLGREGPMERLLLERTLAELDRARRWMLLLGRKTAAERVASFLLDVDRRMSVGCATEDGFDLPLTRGQIADLLGLTIETVSRRLTALKRDGVIALQGTRGVAVRDRARLEVIAEGS